MWARHSHKDSLLKTIGESIDFLWVDLLHKDFPFGGGVYMQILYVGESIAKGFPNKTIKKSIDFLRGAHYIRILYVRSPLQSGSLCGYAFT